MSYDGSGRRKIVYLAHFRDFQALRCIGHDCGRFLTRTTALDTAKFEFVLHCVLSAEDTWRYTRYGDRFEFAGIGAGSWSQKSIGMC